MLCVQRVTPISARQPSWANHLPRPLARSGRRPGDDLHSITDLQLQVSVLQYGRASAPGPCTRTSRRTPRSTDHPVRPPTPSPAPRPSRKSAESRNAPRPVRLSHAALPSQPAVRALARPQALQGGFWVSPPSGSSDRGASGFGWTLLLRLKCFPCSSSTSASQRRSSHPNRANPTECLQRIIDRTDQGDATSSILLSQCSRIRRLR